MCALERGGDDGGTPHDSPDTIRFAALGLLALLVTGVASTALAAPDTVGLVDPDTGVWSLRDDAGGTHSFYYGNPGDTPVLW